MKVKSGTMPLLGVMGTLVGVFLGGFSQIPGGTAYGNVLMHVAALFALSLGVLCLICSYLHTRDADMKEAKLAVPKVCDGHLMTVAVLVLAFALAALGVGFDLTPGRAVLPHPRTLGVIALMVAVSLAVVSVLTRDLPIPIRR